MSLTQTKPTLRETSKMRMRALVFRGKNDIRLEETAVPHAGNGEAVIRVTLTTICGTDLHILRGEVPGAAGSDHRTRGGGRDS